MVFASRSNRVFRFGDAIRAEFSTLIATVRSKRVSRARYTSPMPPAPSGAMISYGPSRVPIEIPIPRPASGGLYTNVRDRKLELRGCVLAGVTDVGVPGNRASVACRETRGRSRHGVCVVAALVDSDA